MVELHNIDNTEHVVYVRKLTSPFRFTLQPLGGVIYGEERVPVEISSTVPNGSIVVGIGNAKKRYYIVHTIDIIYAAYQADQEIRTARGLKGEVKR